eukprot:8928144-Alexandrium_andersonii.AAC.1
MHWISQKSEKSKWMKMKYAALSTSPVPCNALQKRPCRSAGPPRGVCGTKVLSESNDCHRAREQATLQHFRHGTTPQGTARLTVMSAVCNGESHDRRSTPSTKWPHGGGTE